MRAGMTPDAFWDATPDEVMLVVELDYERRQDEDDAAAHYAYLAMVPHMGKKTPKPEKLKRLRPSKGGEQENVVDLEQRRKAREKLAASLAGRKDKIVSRQHRSRKEVG